MSFLFFFSSLSFPTGIPFFPFLPFFLSPRGAATGGGRGRMESGRRRREGWFSLLPFFSALGAGGMTLGRQADREAMRNGMECLMIMARYSRMVEERYRKGSVAGCYCTNCKTLHPFFSSHLTCPHGAGTISYELKLR